MDPDRQALDGCGSGTMVPIRPDPDPDPQNIAQSPSDFLPGAGSTQRAAGRGTGAAETSASSANSLVTFSNSPKTSWNRFKIDGFRRLFSVTFSK